MFFNKKIIITIFAFSFVFCHVNILHAATIENFNFDTASKIIEIDGFCEGHAVSIHIFTDFNLEDIKYSSDVNCENNEFYFQDNLIFWEMPPGEYLVRVYDANSPLSNPSEDRQIVIESIPNGNILDELESNKENQENASEDISDDFLNRFITFFIDWIRGIFITIKEIATEKITTSNLCIGNTCIEEEDLKGFLMEKNNHNNKEEQQQFSEEDVEDVNEEIEFTEENLFEEIVQTSASSTLAEDLVAPSLPELSAIEEEDEDAQEQ
ncbi:MAG: hypothetical protein U9P90_00630 [Patescibacteria group bacterium]|nr:hypothetical protein [Patescibacteria group bacterium]